MADRIAEAIARLREAPYIGTRLKGVTPEALEKMLDVISQMHGFYLNHEILGWGGHEGIGEALTALASAVLEGG